MRKGGKVEGRVEVKEEKRMGGKGEGRGKRKGGMARKKKGVRKKENDVVKRGRMENEEDEKGKKGNGKIKRQ